MPEFPAHSPRAEATEMTHPLASLQAGTTPLPLAVLSLHHAGIRCPRSRMGKGLMKATQQACIRAVGLCPHGVRSPKGSALSFATTVSGSPSGPFLSGQPGSRMQSFKPDALQLQAQAGYLRSLTLQQARPPAFCGWTERQLTLPPG